MKVLAVDDSSTILELIKTILTAEGHQVETSDNGADALSKYVKFKPDIVTLDLTMPIMNGYETLTRLIKLDKNALVIILTASEHWLLLENCFANGAIGYLSKPFTAEELVNTVADPWHYVDKSAVVIFSISCNRIGNSIQKIINSPVAVKLNSVEVTRKEASSHNFSPSSGLIQVPVVEKIVDKVSSQIPTNYVSYLNEFSGKVYGFVRSIVKIESLKQLKVNLSHYFESSEISEFFYSINSKVFSTFAEHNHLPAIILDPPKQIDDTLIDANSNFTELIKAHIQISTYRFDLPLEIHLCSNLNAIKRI